VVINNVFVFHAVIKGFLTIALQWAKVIMSMERSIPPHKCKEYLEAYSITVINFQPYIKDTAHDHRAMHVAESHAVKKCSPLSQKVTFLTLP
jgi:hypothetical protein